METRDRIMQVTFDLLLKNGFDAISISQITKQAGITKGALYYFFENKEDLFNQVVEIYIINFMNQVVDSRIAETSSIKEQIRLFYHVKTVDVTKISNAEDSEGLQQNFYRLLQAGIDKYEKVRDQFSSFNNRTIEYQVKVLEEGKRQGIIRQDLNSEYLALNNMTWGRGMLHFDKSNQVEDVEGMVNEYFDIIWRSISTE